MDTIDRSHEEKINNFRSTTGLILTLAGAILFLDRYLKTGWLSLAILPAIGLFLFTFGVRLHHARLIIAGGLLGGTGVGIAVALNPLMLPQPIQVQVGLVAVFMAAGWLSVAVTTATQTRSSAWWALVPAGVLAGIGIALLYSPMRWVDFVFTVGLGIGFSLLGWGLFARIFGLMIPGSLISTISPGIYYAWQGQAEANTLMQTGIMLVWFAFGWILITVSARYLQQRYLWWPLIPGGILAMVGFGLYIGGDPGNAFGFISNTGAIVLMVFGLYLLLMRKGIHHD